jgi:MFS family permease
VDDNLDRMPSANFGKSVDLLFSRRFGTFVFATLLSNIGTWAQSVAQPWLLLSLGASAFLVGLDAFALGAPVWLLTLVGGVLADRADRRMVITLFQSIQLLCPMLLVVLILTGKVEPWMVIAISLVVGITDSLSMPSFQSIVPSIVERDQIPTGIALNSTQFNLSRILGPVVAGLLMASVGAAGCFALNALSYVPFILVALWILPRGPAARATSEPWDRGHPFGGVREAMREVELRSALLTVLVSGLFCGPLLTFTPVLVRDALQGNVGHFSAAVGAFGVGGLLGAFGLLFVDPARSRRPPTTGFALAYGVIVVAAALNPWLAALPALLVLAGLAMTVSNTSANSLLQSTAPARIRGQTVSLYMLVMRGGISVGSLLTGMSVHWLGVREALLINGAVALVAQGLIGGYWSMQSRRPRH